jgi:hypothetical protein
LAAIQVVWATGRTLQLSSRSRVSVQWLVSALRPRRLPVVERGSSVLDIESLVRDD